MGGAHYLAERGARISAVRGAASADATRHDTPCGGLAVPGMPIRTEVAKHCRSATQLRYCTSESSRQGPGERQTERARAQQAS